MSVATKTKPLSRNERGTQIKNKAGWVITVPVAINRIPVEHMVVVAGDHIKETS